MEIVSPVIDIVSRLWNCSSVRGNYLYELKRNVISLKSAVEKLKERRADVKEKVETAEKNPTEPMKRTHEVSGWLSRVETLEREVQTLLQEEEAANDEGGSYLCCWGRKNFRSGYKIGKSVVAKMSAAEKLLEEGKFDAVAEKIQPDPFRKIPTDKTVGMESNLEKVWSLLDDETSPVRIVGLYGMGGVGKTTLLKKVNNEFLYKDHHFDKVIWVVVSKDLSKDIINIQKQIFNSLGLPWNDERRIDDRANDITQALKNKKFVLLLDDIWERVDLTEIGIPNPEDNLSIVVFTTRSEDVCGFMEADEKIRVDCLQWDESWSLFQEKVGHQALNSHPDIPELAKQVAKECLGLPLALITIGRTMASKTTLPQWKHAINVLQKSPSEFAGMADGILGILKFSFDSLQNDKLQRCFLYCSLYPEDYLIWKEELIKLWIGEGYLDQVEYTDEAYYEGHDVIGSLISACLLESGGTIWVKGSDYREVVKMHDVVRDLAIWIASDLGRKKGKFLALLAQDKLKLHEWQKAEKISLGGNQSIEELNGAPNCSNLSTLLLQRSNVRFISDDFFQFMPMLKVFEMSTFSVDPKIEKLPTSIFSLSELQYLGLSSLGRLALCPGNFVRLTNLKMLDLSDYTEINWEEEGGPSLSELESLQDLNYLGISIGTGIALQRLVCSPRLGLCTKSLMINTCPGIKTLVSSPSSSVESSLVSLANMVSLNTLRLHGTGGLPLELLRLPSPDEFKELRMEDKDTLFTNLEKLEMVNMSELKIVWDVPRSTTFCFVNLKDVSISGCPKLKDTTWLMYAQNLEILYLSYMYGGFEEVISFEEMLPNTFSRLKRLLILGIPTIKRICNPNVRFLSLELIDVGGCPELKKLPFDNNSDKPNTSLIITGRNEWWEELEWEDETTKSNFAPYFVNKEDYMQRRKCYLPYEK